MVARTPDHAAAASGIVRPKLRLLNRSGQQPFSAVCHFWNQGSCVWSFGRCCYQHIWEQCRGEHARVNCSFPLSTGHSPGPPLWLAQGDGSKPAGSLVVHSVYSFSSCLVPVSVGGRLVSGPSPDPKCTQVNVAVSVFWPLVSVDHVSSLILSKFWAELINHPNRSTVAYVLSRVQFGFQVGFLKSASSNTRSFKP